MSAGQQIGLIGSSVRVQSLPTASAATFGEGNRFYTLIGHQAGYITGHTYRTVMANDVYSWEDVRNELMLLALVDGTITANSSIEVALSNFNRQPLVDNLLIVYSNANQYALMKVSAVTSTAATLIVKDNSAANIVSTKGETGAAGVGITNATASEPIVADGKTTTPITFSFSDGTTKEFNVEAQNGTDGAQGIGVKSITSGTPTVVNDKTNTPIVITLTDNTTVGLVVSAENGKDGTSATVDIVQATGQSTTAVMSQKAVTDELNKKANTSDIPTKTSQLTNDSNYATKSYVDTQDNKKLDKAGGSVTGNLTIGGNLIVNGATTSIDSTTLQVKDKLIEVAHGNTATLTTPAGLVAPKYDGTNSGALVFDSTGTAYVGDVKFDSTGNIDVPKSGLQPLATRTGLVGGNLVQYDSSAQTLKDSGKKISDLATTSQVNAKYTKPSGGIPKTDLASDVQTSLEKADTALQRAPVTSVNGKTGDVTLGAGDVGALPSSTKFVSSVNGKTGAVTGLATQDEVNAKQNTLTETQLAAVNSGVTQAKITKYDGYDATIKQKVNVSDLAKVATSGSYNDLTNTPTIPTVNNGTLTIQKNGTNVATFGANQSTNATANITVPTKTSQLTNDSNFVKSNSGAFTGNLTADNFNSRFSLQSVPYGTAVGENADLNTVTYLSVGNYYCGADAIVSTMANVPVKRAFMMTVYSPLTPTVDNEPTGKWVYRVRKFMTYLGEEYIQSVYSGSTAGTFTYNAWQQIAHKSDIPTFSLSGTTLTITL